MELDCFFQFVRGWAGFILLQQHQCQIEMNVGVSAVERLGGLQRRLRGGDLSGFEVREAEPMLQLGIARPANNRFFSKLRRFAQASQLQIAEYQAAVGL